MLQLNNIKKVYASGDNAVQALDGVSLNFRHNEFVSILGPSGCGKTTLLNIVGGLDRYNDGDLISLKTATGTPIATTPSVLYSRAITSSPTRRCCKT